MSPAFFASAAVRFFALVTRSWASFGFRPWAAAKARIEAEASFLIFRARSWLSPPGPIAIGVAEPMFVSGAIAATSAASVMYAPAEPARAPFGETYTTTGIGAAAMSWMIERIESDRPPGV